MIGYGYVSRAVPDPKIFEQTRDERFAAKARGDKQTANTLKGPLNKSYGAMINKYNPMYDPGNGRSVCISGQLSITELVVAYSRIEGLRILQINTDGVMISIPEEVYETVIAVNEWWQEQTGLLLEEDRIEFVWQKDVNNYVMRTTDGHEKVKGSYLVRGISPIGAWSINNNAVVVAEALKAYLLDGVPVRQTIEACDDPFKFQLIAKAGHKYSRVYQLINNEEVEIQKCNRVFACSDESLGRLYKVKAADGSIAKIESLPEHCLVSNEGMCRMEQIDKEWYVALAEKRAHDFEPEEGESMATAKKAETSADYTSMNVYQKLAIARRMFAEANPKMSGKNRHLEFEYYELKDLAPIQTRIFAEVGLIELFDEVYTPEIVLNQENGEFRESRVMPPEHYALATVVNVDNPQERIEFKTLWSELAPILNKNGAEAQNALQRHGSEQTYLRRYAKLKVLDASEPDENEAESGSVKAEAKPLAPTAKAAPKKPATEAERKQAATKVANADAPAPKLQLNALKKAIKSINDEYGSTHPEVKAKIAEISAATKKLTEITKKQCEQAIKDLGDLKAAIEKEE